MLDRADVSSSPRPERAPLTPHVLLLRGVNVGGKNRLPMKDLAAVVTAAGGTEVRTYIQSGNVVCVLEEGAAARVALDVAAGIEGRFGFKAPVVVRSAAEWAAVQAARPFPEANPETLYVAFLRDWPEPERVASLEPDRSPGDRFVVIGRDVFLHLPNGVARSKLTNDWMDRRLATVSTARNWRTVGVIGGMVGSPTPSY